jgi:adenylate cyclase
MTDLRIYLLGQFQVSLNGESVSGFVSDKVRALLAYLAVEGAYPQRREILANLFWPEKTDSRARANLRRALSNLRQVIGDTQADLPYISTTYQEIKVNQNSNVWVDVDLLTHVFYHPNVRPDNLILYDQILNIYQGEFLKGFFLPDSLPFDEWALLKREQYTRMMDAVLERVINYCIKLGDFESALPFAWRHVELEPWQERARRQLMGLLSNTGRRDEALCQYISLKSVLQSEFQINPSAKSRQLYRDIQEGKEAISILRGSGPFDDLPPLPKYMEQTKPIEVENPETFVGRLNELNQLHDLLDGVIEGQGDIVMVTGEAGSGKSMLVKEFFRQAQSRYPNLVSALGYCNAFTGAGDPYLPLREILYQLCGDIESYWKAGSCSYQNAVSIWKTIPITCQSILTFGPALIDRLIPGQTLLELLASFSKTKYDCFSAVDQHLRFKQQHPGSAIKQTNLISQFMSVLQKISDQVPLILFLDDLQWADKGTINMMFHFIKHIVQSRILLIGAYRNEEVGLVQDDKRHRLIPLMHEVQRDFGDVDINLGLDSGRDFVKALAISEPNDLPPAIIEKLIDLTGGNALFTIELLISMQEDKTLYKNERGVWTIKDNFNLAKLPPRTEGVIAERISRLPQALKRVLSLASIEGESFTAEIIAAVEGRPVDEVVTLLSEQLVRQHRLIQPHQIIRRDKQIIFTYRFRHSLFQKHIYYHMDEIQRSRLHARVGTEMETLAGENKADFAVHLARHFHQANQPEKAFNYHTIAGKRAVRMAAFPEAINQFEAALEMLLFLPENSARNEKELDLQLQIGLAYQATEGYANEKVGKAYKRAWELCRSGGDYLKRITTIQLLNSYYVNIADFKTSQSMLSLLESNYNELEEVIPEFSQHLHWGFGYLDSIFGRHQSVSDHMNQAIKYYNQAAQHSGRERLGIESGIYCHGWAGLHENWLGYPDIARMHIQAIQKIAEESHSTLFTRDALWFSAWINLELGDIHSAREHIAALLDMCVKEVYCLFEGVARIFNGKVLSFDRHHQQAIASFQKGWEMYYQTGMETFKPDWLYYLADIYRNAGQVEDGLVAVAKAEKVEKETGEGRYKSALKRVKGDLYLLKGDEQAAEDAYLKAIAIAQGDGTKMFELEAVKHMARMWRKQGKVDQGREMLQDIYDWFTEGFDTPMLVEAKRMLAE